MRKVVTIGLDANDNQELSDNLNKEYNLCMETALAVPNLGWPELVIIKASQDVCKLVLEIKRLYGCLIIVIDEDQSVEHRLGLMWAGATEILISPYHFDLADIAVQTLQANDEDQRFRQKLYNTCLTHQGEAVKLKPKGYDLLVYKLLTDDATLSNQQILTAIAQTDLATVKDIDSLIDTKVL